MKALILTILGLHMTKFIEVFWTTGSIDEARKISRYLVQERIVGSAQIVPWIESIYMLNNQLETAQESKVVFKAVHERFDEIKELIEKNCTYEIPEITYRFIDGGNKNYLDWLSETTMLRHE